MSESKETLRKNYKNKLTKLNELNDPTLTYSYEKNLEDLDRIYKRVRELNRLEKLSKINQSNNLAVTEVERTLLPQLPSQNGPFYKVFKTKIDNLKSLLNTTERRTKKRVLNRLLEIKDKKNKFGNNV